MHSLQASSGIQNCINDVDENGVRVVVIVDDYFASSLHDLDKATYPGLSRTMNRR